MRVAFLGVVPSPYQVDVLVALGREAGLELEAFWLERAAPDSPWVLGEPGFASRILPGVCWGRGRIRSHWNWSLPEWRRWDVVVVNTSLTDGTTQWVIRSGCGGRPWLFWGERQGGGRLGHWLAGPLWGASGILAVGRRAAEDYGARFPEVRVWELPYHCELEAFRACRARPGVSDEVRFLFCGQMIRRKGIDLLVGAFARLVEAGLRVKLVLVGRVDREGEAVLEAVAARVRKRVECVGFVAPEGLPDWFGGADVFVLPSRREGWGVVVNQAAAAGLPLILSDAVESGDEWLEPGENGWRVVAGDRLSLEEAMREAALDRNRLGRMGSASAARAEGRDARDGAARLAAVLREVAG